MGVPDPAPSPLEAPARRAGPDLWLSAPHLGSIHGFNRAAAGQARPRNLSERGPRSPLERSPLERSPLDLSAAREAALAALGLTGARVARLDQVHGAEVLEARAGLVGRADGLVTREHDLALVIETADCLALLFEDASAGVIAAAHAGWRGTLAGVAAGAVRAMQARGAAPERIRVAIGPGLCRSCLEVGPEVRDAFLEAGFPAGLFTEGPAELSCDESASVLAPDWSVPLNPFSAAQARPPQARPARGGRGKWRLNLAAANLFVLSAAGVPVGNVLAVNACTRSPGFFSYRRDAGSTGRHWAVIGRGRP